MSEESRVAIGLEEGERTIFIPANEIQARINSGISRNVSLSYYQGTKTSQFRCHEGHPLVFCQRASNGASEPNTATRLLGVEK